MAVVCLIGSHGRHFDLRIHYALASLVLVLACLHVLLFLMAWTLSQVTAIVVLSSELFHASFHCCARIRQGNAAMKFKAFRAAWNLSLPIAISTVWFYILQHTDLVESAGRKSNVVRVSRLGTATRILPIGRRSDETMPLLHCSLYCPCPAMTPHPLKPN